MACLGAILAPGFERGRGCKSPASATKEKMMELFILLVVIYLVLSPPKYDPAIRLKEWLDRK